VRPTTAAAGAAALLLAAGLAACSGDPEPGSPLPTGEPVASATGSAEPTGASPSTAGDPSASPTEQPVAVPTLPPEATTNDAAGAEAFIRYWFDAVNHAYGTFDVAPLEEISDEACGVCSSIASEVEDLAAQGTSVSGGSYVLEEVSAPAPDPTGVNIVSLVYTRQPLVFQDDETSTPAESPPPPVSVAAVLEWRGESWRMYDFGQ